MIWKELKLELPFEEEDVLVCDELGNMTVGHLTQDGDMKCDWEDCAPTHWTELPKAPKQ